MKKKYEIPIRTDYLDDLYSPSFFKKIPLAVKKIKIFRKKYQFDAIAFTGNSGAGFAFPLSYLLKIPVINVRKKGGHYSGPIEGALVKRYLIVDDFIDSGKTMKKIISTINKNIINSKPVGIFLYDSTSTSLKFFNKIPVITLR